MRYVHLLLACMRQKLGAKVIHAFFAVESLCGVFEAEGSAEQRWVSAQQAMVSTAEAARELDDKMLSLLFLQQPFQ